MEARHPETATEPADVDAAVLAGVTLLCHAGNHVRRHLERTVLHDAGLSWTSFDILNLAVSVWPIDTRTVAEVAGISKATVSITTNALTARGLLVRGFDPGDKRRVQLHPTAAATQLIGEVRTRLLAQTRRLLLGGDPAVSSAALALLRNLISRLGRDRNAHRPRHLTSSSRKEPL